MRFKKFIKIMSIIIPLLQLNRFLFQGNRETSMASNFEFISFSQTNFISKEYQVVCICFYTTGYQFLYALQRLIASNWPCLPKLNDCLLRAITHSHVRSGAFQILSVSLRKNQSSFYNFSLGIILFNLFFLNFQK